MNDLSQILPIILFGIVLLVALFFIFNATRKTKVVDRTTGDVLDEGAQKAARNQALIDAPTAVAKDVGQTSANANSDKIAAAGAMADAEAGAQVTPAPAVAPKPVPTPAPAPAATGGTDDLRKIKGVGPKLVALLNEQGITSFAQIAAWSDADVARVDATLGRFSGRIERDQWVEQAKLLASGEETAFSAKFGNK